jgi:hypothetical protein
MMAILRTVLLGAWVCGVALAAAYVSAGWNQKQTVQVARAENQLNSLEFKKPAAITVPMISDDRLRGYVVAQIVYTANAKAAASFPIDPQPFVLDEAFRRIYTDGKIEFGHLSKYNLDDMTKAIKDAVNARLGVNLIDDVLISELNYVDKDSLGPDGGGASSGSTSPTGSAAAPGAT